MGVMNTKLNTKAFGQSQTSPISSNNLPTNLSAADMKKLGSEDVGDVLNKVADPNWVDPSKKVRTVGNDKLDKDAFFKLMLAQMKNQDPTNPLQSHEMAAQLANFSALEQMQNMNKTLGEMKEGQKPVEQFQVLQLLGKNVSGDSSKVFRAKGDKNHELQFDLPTKAKEASIRIRNADGDVVRSYKINNLNSGTNNINWNGLDEKGNVLPEGEYQFFIEAKNEQDKKIAIKTEFEGAISGVNYTSEGPILMVGNQAIRLRDVKKIVDPNVQNKEKMQSDVNSEKDTLQKMDSLKTGQAAGEAKPKSKILDQVGLSQEMMNKVIKETN